MEQEKDEPFHLLPDEQFFRLSKEEKLAYLSRFLETATRQERLITTPPQEKKTRKKTRKKTN